MESRQTRGGERKEGDRVKPPGIGDVRCRGVSRPALADAPSSQLPPRRSSPCREGSLSSLVFRRENILRLFC